MAASTVSTPPHSRLVGIISSPITSGFSGNTIGNGRTCGPNASNTTPRSSTSRPIVTITIANTDSPTRRAKKMRSISQPTTPASTKASGMPTIIGSPMLTTIHHCRNPPSTTSSPCAKLNTLLAR